MQRIVFTEITPRAIKEAIQKPRMIASDLVDAQQARRALDYLVGFNLSPVLWRKVQRGLSAGRVQSPALRMIVEREEEIEAFITREYWSIHAECAHPAQHFSAKLIKLDGQKFEQFTITDSDTAAAAQRRIQQVAQDACTSLTLPTKNGNDALHRPSSHPHYSKKPHANSVSLHVKRCRLRKNFTRGSHWVRKAASA